nr:NADH dehydrogenase subunit 2 [Scotomedes sp. HL-2012]
MFKYSSSMLFMLMLVLSSILTMSSSNWLSTWMGLEMNLIAFIPILSKAKSNPSSESMMMYFLIQSMGSTLILFSILINSTSIMSHNITDMFTVYLIMLSMLMKLGAPPFHSWFVNMNNKLNWVNSLLLMTWQKLAPLTIMSFIMSSINLNSMFILMAVMIGAIGGINQTSIRKIMAYSSINHMGWMMAAMKMNNNMWMLYLIMYSIILLMAVNMFMQNSIFYINQLIINSNKYPEKLMYIINFMSMGGLPPFMGFLPKWMVIQLLIELNLYLLSTIMVLFSLLTLFYYLRMMSSIMLINFSCNKMYLKYPNTNPNYLMMIIINLTLPMTYMFHL